jgi:hypothetical protein
LSSFELNRACVAAPGVFPLSSDATPSDMFLASEPATNRRAVQMVPNRC